MSRTRGQDETAPSPQLGRGLSAFHNWCDEHGSWCGDEGEPCPKCLDLKRWLSVEGSSRLVISSLEAFADTALSDALAALETVYDAYGKAGLPRAVIGAALHLIRGEKEDRDRV